MFLNSYLANFRILFLSSSQAMADKRRKSFVILGFFLKNSYQKTLIEKPLYLQTCIKESFMYFSCHLFFKTPHKTLKFPQKLLPLQTKNINNMTEWRYSQVTFTEKKIILTSFLSAVRKSVGNTFSGNLET